MGLMQLGLCGIREGLYFHCELARGFQTTAQTMQHGIMIIDYMSSNLLFGFADLEAAFLPSQDGSTSFRRV